MSEHPFAVGTAVRARDLWCAARRNVEVLP
jgi:hypothetical protein